MVSAQPSNTKYKSQANPIGSNRCRNSALAAQFPSYTSVQYRYPDEVTYPEYRHTKHMPVGLTAGGVLKPCTEYSTSDAFRAEFAGLIDSVSQLEKKRVIVFEQHDSVHVELATSTALKVGDYLKLYVDPATSKCHPFKAVQGASNDWIYQVIEPPRQSPATIVVCRMVSTRRKVVFN
jgi:hypothetical protein